MEVIFEKRPEEKNQRLSYTKVWDKAYQHMQRPCGRNWYIQGIQEGQWSWRLMNEGKHGMR